MPFKSEAQRQKFLDKVRSGEMDQATFDEWNKDTPENLPDRVAPQPKSNPFTGKVRKIKVVR